VIDSGNLLCGSHVEKPCAKVEVAGVDQAPTEVRNWSMQSANRSGVCTDM
jgi:hypothetical protein